MLNDKKTREQACRVHCYAAVKVSGFRRWGRPDSLSFVRLFSSESPFVVRHASASHKNPTSRIWSCIWQFHKAISRANAWTGIAEWRAMLFPGVLLAKRNEHPPVKSCVTLKPFLKVLAILRWPKQKELIMTGACWPNC